MQNETLTLQWRANDGNFYRIDFNTPTITFNSNFRLFHSFILNNSLIGAADIPNDHWYNVPQPPGENLVRDNIITLQNFINIHSGTSDEYNFARNTLNNILLSSGIGAASRDGNYKKKSRSKKKSKLRKRSKSKLRKRSKKKSRIKKKLIIYNL